jgi:hypothetical protein
MTNLVWVSFFRIESGINVKINRESRTHAQVLLLLFLFGFLKARLGACLSMVQNSNTILKKGVEVLQVLSGEKKAELVFCGEFF